MPTRSRLLPSPNGRHRLSIEGELSHPHWAAFLFSGLSLARVSVISGTASRAPSRVWEASFELEFRGSLVQPGALDALALLQKGSGVTPPAPRLGGYSVKRRADEGLDVRLHGEDQIGFLGGTLMRISTLALFPSALEIATLNGRIRDRLVLRGMGGSAPSDRAAGALEALLSRLSGGA